MKYVIGTRGSKLALVQAEYVLGRLTESYPQHTFEIRVIRTKGDCILDKPLHELGDKGVFVKEIEQEILDHTVDIGVHSMKDMPSSPAPGLMFAKAWKREDPRDALILREKHSLAELPEGAVIGTGSRRREFQLKRIRRDLTVVNIRGNVETRLRKMEEEKLDGIVLAAAGLKRLGLLNRVSEYLDAEAFLPAPAQGVLALEIRNKDTGLLKMLDALCEEETVCAVEAERGFLREIGGDCHIPVGAFARRGKDGKMLLSAMFGNRTGSKLAYATACGTDPKVLAKEAAARIRQQMAGTVFLVGAGPGDPGLITVKGLATIQEADCIVYDRLSSPELLREAKPGCELIYAGKESHNHTMKQEEINWLLVKKSMEHEKIVRLKGGDIYVFGRGGEEGLYLKEHGVPFEIIPGITSAVAGPAYAGIPVTHRGIAAGFHVVTAHNRKDELADIDFQAMAKSQETCVFLMGLSKVEEIADKLMKAGMPALTKAAVMSHATTPKQKTCVSDLAHIAEDVKRAQLTSPAIIIIGQVISLRDTLNFFEKQPLFGKRYLIPKIGEKPSRLLDLLRKEGADADEIQVGEISYTGRQFTKEEIQTVDWLVFTSKNGVEAFFRGMKESRLDIRNLSNCKIAVIGKKTSDMLQKYGLYADLMPERFDSDALAEELRKYLGVTESADPQSKDSLKKVWYLKAGNADSHLKEALDKLCCFEEITVYENRYVEPDLTCLASPSEYDGILFTCASSAERFLETAEELWRQSNIYSIGNKTTDCLKRYNVKKVTQAEEPSYESMIEILTQFTDRL